MAPRNIDALDEMMQKLMSLCPGSTVLCWDNLFLKHKLDNTAQKNATLIYASSRSALLEWKFVKLSCSHCKYEPLFIANGLWTDTRDVCGGITDRLG